MYHQLLSVLSRILTQLYKSRLKVIYHWSEVWRSLLSFARFLTSYADDLKSMGGTSEIVDTLVEVLSTAMTSGEAFLPDATSYDDLFYKLVESGEALVKLRDTYGLSEAGVSSPVNNLIGVSKHYQELIEDQRAKKEHLSPREVNKIIKKGYETLNIETSENVSQVEKFKEAEHKSELKKIVRIAVADALAVVSK